MLQTSLLAILSPTRIPLFQYLEKSVLVTPARVAQPVQNPLVLVYPAHRLLFGDVLAGLQKPLMNQIAFVLLLRDFQLRLVLLCQIRRRFEDLIYRQRVHIVDYAREENLGKAVRDFQLWCSYYVHQEMVRLSKRGEPRLELELEQLEAVLAVRPDGELSAEQLDERLHGVEELVF